MAQAVSRFVCIVIPARIWLSAGFKEEAFFKFAESCGRFSPQLAIRPPEALWIEIGRSRHLIREERLQAQLEVLARRFGIAEIQMGIAPTAAQAWIAAQYAAGDALSGEIDWSLVPVAALFDLLDPFQQLAEAARFELQARVAEWVSVLDAMGVQSLAEWLEIPHSELVARFGASALEAVARCEGERDAVWAGWRTEEPIVESWDASDLEVSGGPQYAECDDKTSRTPADKGDSGGDLERLLFLLKPLIDRGLTRLHGRNERVSRARLKLECDRLSGGDPVLQWDWEFPFAPGSVTAIVPILRESLSREFERRPLQGLVRRMHWEILQSVPGRSAQMDGFSGEMEEAQEQLTVLWGRLAARLGQGSVFRWRAHASYLPERQAQEVSASLPEAMQEASLPARLPFELPRPARLLRHPQRLNLDQVPVTQMEGPERVVAEWWDGVRPRDYYRLWTRSGRSLWVYREPDGEVFLHGYFD